MSKRKNNKKQNIWQIIASIAILTCIMISGYMSQNEGTTKKLANRLSEHKIAIIIVIIFAIGSTIFSIVGPKILGNATTEIYTGLMNKINGTIL